MISAQSLLRIAALALLWPLPATAQENAPPPEPTEQAAAAAEAEDTIVVLGNPEDMPVVAGQVTNLGNVSRRIGTDSDRFARCAPLPDRAMLSAILDGPPTLLRTQMAMHRYIASNKGCYGHQVELAQAPELGVCNPEATQLYPTTNICRAVYDRGALYARALREVVGDLRLTRDDTFDSNVRARFLERETRRNIARGAIDRNYFNTVACMVQIMPDAGVSMMLASPRSDQAERARQALISNGGACVGFARQVRADPDQFRAYVAEAVYSWLVAKRDRESLIVRNPATY